VAHPLSINVDTYGTGKYDENLLQELLENGDHFDFRPAAISDALGLLHPDGWSYQRSAAYGHFGREDFPWEKTDKAEELSRAARRLARQAA
jgi:S-adenosylmethionine synthetase